MRVRQTVLRDFARMTEVQHCRHRLVRQLQPAILLGQLGEILRGNLEESGAVRSGGCVAARPYQAGTV